MPAGMVPQRETVCFPGAYVRGGDFPGGSATKSLPANAGENRVRSLGQQDYLEEEMAAHSSIRAWEIPWTVEPGGLQSTGSQRVRHD